MWPFNHLSMLQLRCCVCVCAFCFILLRLLWMCLLFRCLQLLCYWHIQYFNVYSDLATFLKVFIRLNCLLKDSLGVLKYSFIPSANRDDLISSFCICICLPRFPLILLLTIKILGFHWMMIVRENILYPWF